MNRFVSILLIWSLIAGAAFAHAPASAGAACSHAAMQIMDGDQSADPMNDAAECGSACTSDSACTSCTPVCAGGAPYIGRDAVRAARIHSASSPSLHPAAAVRSPIRAPDTAPPKTLSS